MAEVAVDSVRGEMTIKHLLPIDETLPLPSRGHSAEGRATSEVRGAGERAPRAKRYAFCYAFGLRTGDDDDDSQAVGEAEKSHAKPAPPQPVTAKPYNPKEEGVKLRKKLGVDTRSEDKEKRRQNYEPWS